MIHATSILLMTLTAVLAAPALDTTSTGLSDEDYYTLEADRRDYPEQIILPQKRAALVLDRLLIALQKALHDESAGSMDAERDGPRTAPLRIANMETNDVTGLQRRGQSVGRGRVLRCYFNAITCF